MTVDKRLSAAVDLLKKGTSDEEKFAGLMLIPRLVVSSNDGKETQEREQEALVYVIKNINYIFLKRLLLTTPPPLSNPSQSPADSNANLITHSTLYQIAIHVILVLSTGLNHENVFDVPEGLISLYPLLLDKFQSGHKETENLNNSILQCIESFLQSIHQSTSISSTNPQGLKEAIIVIQESLARILAEQNTSDQDKKRILLILENIFDGSQSSQSIMISSYLLNTLLQITTDPECSNVIFEGLSLLTAMVQAASVSKENLKMITSNQQDFLGLARRLIRSKLSFEQRNVSFLFVATTLYTFGLNQLIHLDGKKDEQSLLLLTHLLCAETRVILDHMSVEEKSYVIAVSEEDKREHVAISKSLLPVCLDVIGLILNFLVNQDDHENEQEEQVYLGFEIVLSIQKALTETFSSVEDYLMEVMSNANTKFIMNDPYLPQLVSLYALWIAENAQDGEEEIEDNVLAPLMRQISRDSIHSSESLKELLKSIGI